MKPGSRTLLKIHVEDGEETATTRIVERLMGNKPEERFRFITENAEFAEEVLDV